MLVVLSIVFRAVAMLCLKHLSTRNTLTPIVPPPPPLQPQPQPLSAHSAPGGAGVAAGLSAPLSPLPSL